MKKISGYLRLMRPANIVTSVGDVLAGITIAGFFGMYLPGNWPWLPVILLCLSTIGLYGGGVVFNDVFDAALDSAERPERPIPSGLIPILNAALLGAVLLTFGILAAGFVGKMPLLLAIAIAVAALVYNKWGKHQSYLGPLNMGVCRGLNLLLGMSIVGRLPAAWTIAVVPVIYIATITMISRGEVHGMKKYLLFAATFLYGLVIAAIFRFALVNGTAIPTSAFLLCFAWMIFTPLLKAIRSPLPGNIGKSVKAGVIALIIMDASWSAAFGSWQMALVILLLLPLSLGLARLFAVT